MELNPRVSRRAMCSYPTVANRTCKTVATRLCSSCNRFACENHVLTRAGGQLCAACDYLIRQLEAVVGLPFDLMLPEARAVPIDDELATRLW